MSHNNSKPVFNPVILIAIGLFAGSGALMPIALELSGAARLLPVSMLVAMMVLAVVLAVMTFLDKKEVKPALESPKRVIFAFIAVVSYSICVSLIGFYPTTAIFIPVAAYLFGCKNLKVLAIADLAVLAVIYSVFGLAMSKDFPTGILW